jgi:hypothetical protein
MMDVILKRPYPTVTFSIKTAVMKKLLLLLMSLLILAGSCTITRLTSVWKDPSFESPVYKNIMVIALLEGVNKRELREYFENHMAGDLLQMGYNAKATTVYGPRSFQGKSEEEVIQLLRTDGYDAVITITVLDVLKEDNYVRGTVEYWPGGIYYSRFGRYYYYWYNRVYQPGYYVTSTTYLVEGNLFDIARDRLVFSAQTESMDPATLDNLGHRFSITLLKAMKEKGVLK